MAGSPRDQAVVTADEAATLPRPSLAYAASKLEGRLFLDFLEGALVATEHIRARTIELGLQESVAMYALCLDYKDDVMKIGRLYDAKTTPHMFVIDPAGVLRPGYTTTDVPTCAGTRVAVALPAAHEPAEGVPTGRSNFFAAASLSFCRRSR